ncbi:MAG: dTDP-4-dehydrorhamnose 3,5-epimerase [Nitrospirae bacterium]|nr:dTDP-4-dehydrorhamnose 3,5-epimerase [Nitrospirota bacterium]MCK6491870.1 dTDP-4-dehydrorhamnose 3,5-epimerase [Nitrospira sp.]
MQITSTPLPGLVQIEPDVFRDPRGRFVELYRQPRYEAAGIDRPFVQDNFSWSVRGTLRGLHYQLGRPQGKLVTVIKGTVFDVAVDIRQGSPTFGQWYGVELSDTNMRQLYVPPGFAHGFCVLSDEAGFLYKCTDLYSPQDERGIVWNDPALSIAWPVTAPLLSAKDQAYKSLTDMITELPRYIRP